MSTDVEVFQFPATGSKIRTVIRDGEPWFVVADVCRVLGLSNPTVTASRLDTDDLSTAEVIDSVGRTQSARTANESALYELIFQSRKPEAKAFKRWVTHEVLPAIRKTGRYETALPAELDELEVARRYVVALEDKRRLQAELVERERELAVVQPAAAAWNTLASADGDFSVGDAAKILSRDPAIKLGRDRLFTLLHEWGWTYRQRIDNRWRPLQTAIETRRLSELPSTHYHPRTGELVSDPPQVRVTFKGLAELHRRLGGTAQLQLAGLADLPAVAGT